MFFQIEQDSESVTVSLECLENLLACANKLLQGWRETRGDAETHWLPMPPEPAMATTQTGGDGFYWALFDDANPEIVELADGGTTLYRIGTDMAAFLKDGQWFAGDGPFEIAKLVGPLNAPILQKQVHDLTK